MRQMSVLVLALALAVPASAAGGPSAADLLKRIADQGGHKVLWDLWEREKEFYQVMSDIESGDPSWLKVAAAFKPFSDAGAALSIDYSVAFALPQAPERVLALVGHGFNLEDVCTSPFLEPEPGEAEAYEKKALSALARINDPALKPVAARCAAQVRLAGGT